MSPEETLYTHLHESGQHEQAWKLADEMDEQGLMPKYDPDSQTFSFVNTDNFMSGRLLFEK